MSVAPEQIDTGGALGKETVSALGGSAESEDCDPYLQISIPSLRQSRHTRYIQHNRNPDWNETLVFTGVTGRMEMMDIRCMDHDVMSKNDSIGQAFFRVAELVIGVEKDVWIHLQDVSSGRINLRMTLQMDGTLNVVCVAGRDLEVQGRWEMKKRDFSDMATNVRDAWERDDAIPDQSNLPQHPEMPVCSRLVTDGYCMYGAKCQFHHPEHVKRRPQPPPREKRLEIKQGFWGYLREGDINSGSLIDVTDMLKDIVIEQQGIQLELPKQNKHLLWRKAVTKPDSGLIAVGEEKKLPQHSSDEEDDPMLGDGDTEGNDGAGSARGIEPDQEGEEEEEDQEDDGDPNAPPEGRFEWIVDWLYGLTTCTCSGRDPRYGLKIWYYVKGDQMKIQSWRHTQAVYIESFLEARKHRYQRIVKRIICGILFILAVCFGFWVNWMLDGMACDNAEYSGCKDASGVFQEPCVLNFEFAWEGVRHINVSNERGSILVRSSASSSDIQVEITQTVVIDGAMEGLSSSAAFDNETGVLNVHSEWNKKHAEDKSFPDLYGGAISMYNCPTTDIVITVPANEKTTRTLECTMQEKASGCSLFSPSLTATMIEPEYECSFKAPQACFFGALIIMSVELQSTIEILIAGNVTDTLPWPASTSTSSSFSQSTISQVTRSVDDYELFPGRVVNFNRTVASVDAGQITVENVKSENLDVMAGSGEVTMAATKAHLTSVTSGGTATLSRTALPRSFARGQLLYGPSWQQYRFNGLLTLSSDGSGSGGQFSVQELMGGDLLARPGESGQLDAAVKLNAFQGTVRLTGSGSNSVAAPAGYRHACGANSACEAGPGLAFFVGSQTGCNATHDYDCTYQELNVTEGGATVTVD